MRLTLWHDFNDLAGDWIARSFTKLLGWLLMFFGWSKKKLTDHKAVRNFLCFFPVAILVRGLGRFSPFSINFHYMSVWLWLVLAGLGVFILMSYKPRIANSILVIFSVVSLWVGLSVYHGHKDNKTPTNNKSASSDKAGDSGSSAEQAKKEVEKPVATKPTPELTELLAKSKAQEAEIKSLDGQIRSDREKMAEFRSELEGIRSGLQNEIGRVPVQPKISSNQPEDNENDPEVIRLKKLKKIILQ